MYKPFIRYVTNTAKRELLPYHWSRRGLPSLTSTKRPPSPLEIRKSSSRYVVRSQDLVRSPGIGSFRGGWPEIALDMLDTTSCSGERDCCKGDKLIFCPKMLTLSGRSILGFISGGSKVPSLNCTYTYLEKENNFLRFLMLDLFKKLKFTRCLWSTEPYNQNTIHCNECSTHIIWCR